MRKLLIAGNWKMNLLLAPARELVAAIRAAASADTVEVLICPPFVYLMPMAKAIAGSSIRMGAQNAYFESSGAFTGEVSPAMLKDAGCSYVILGHSERRHTIGPRLPDGRIAGEDDASVNRKVRAVLAAGMSPILCVGETLAERDTAQTLAVLRRQLDGGLAGLSADEAGSLVIAYEPVWAIGTGRNATPQQAQEAHAFIRNWLSERFGPATAAGTRILYGGSMKAANAGELIAQPDVDGGLVGGASLKADEFCGIIAAALRAKRLPS